MEHSSDDYSGFVPYVPPPISEVLEPRLAVCPKHGEFTSKGTRFTTGRRLEIWTQCPGCSEDAADAQRESAEAERQARAKARLEEMLGTAAIPVRFIGRSFENYRAVEPSQLAALTAVREYAEGFDRHARTGESLLLLGKAGTGKSHLASAVLQSIMPAHCGMYTTAADVIDMVRETWRRDSEKSQGKVLQMLASVPLLVIDEVGVQYGTESEQNTLFQILDRRYRDRRPVILMANLKPAELQSLLGDRVFDRLREVSRVVLFDWESYRPTARKEAA